MHQLASPVTEWEAPGAFTRLAECLKCTNCW